MTRSEVFYTSVDFQEAVEIKVYQGEAENALDNLEVGRFRVEGLAKCRQGSEIIATFALDSNGILQVSAKEKATGLEKSITIDNVLADTTADSLQQAREKIGRLFGDTAGAAGATGATDVAGSLAEGAGPGMKTVTNSRKVQVEALLEKARSLLEKAGEDDREDMIELIETIDQAMDDGATDLLEESMEELSEIIFYMES